MTVETSPEARLVGYVYKLTTVLSDGQQLEISGNLALDAGAEDMNRQFDLLTKVANRQAAKHRVAKKEGEIAADEAMVNSMKLDLNSLDETVGKEYAGRQVPTAEKNNRLSMVRNIRHLEGRVADGKKQLEVLKEEAK